MIGIRGSVIGFTKTVKRIFFIDSYPLVYDVDDKYPIIYHMFPSLKNFFREIVSCRRDYDNLLSLMLGINN